MRLIFLLFFDIFYFCLSDHKIQDFYICLLHSRSSNISDRLDRIFRAAPAAPESAESPATSVASATL
jgi:hypothetical protein